MYNDVDKRMSLHYCKTKYGLYGLFATYPLRTAVLNSDAYELIDFELAFQYSGENHRSDPQFANYFDSLTYDDKHYFTVDEIRFLLEISAPCQPLEDKQVDTDLKEVTADVKRGNMMKSHAAIVLKAIQYWNLHYKEKYGQYFQEFCDADEAWLERRVAGQDLERRGRRR
jgi:hypothetical protein